MGTPSHTVAFGGFSHSTAFSRLRVGPIGYQLGNHRGRSHLDPKSSSREFNPPSFAVKEHQKALLEVDCNQYGPAMVCEMTDEYDLWY